MIYLFGIMALIALVILYDMLSAPIPDPLVVFLCIVWLKLLIIAEYVVWLS